MVCLGSHTKHHVESLIQGDFLFFDPLMKLENMALKQQRWRIDPDFWHFRMIFNILFIIASDFYQTKDQFQKVFLTNKALLRAYFES